MGTEIHKVGKAVIRNTGKEIKISKGGCVATLKKAIEMAQQLYGNCIQVNGSPLFKNIIIQLTVQNKIPITFAEPEMESQRKHLTLEQGKHHEQSRRYGFNDRTRTSGSHEATGTITRARRKQRGILSGTKSNPISTRQSPPAESQNSLRDLSQLDVVQLTGGSKVLLSDNAHDKLEPQGLQSDNHVRRKFFGLSKKQNKSKPT